MISKTKIDESFPITQFCINPSRTDPGRREKINSNFYFHTSLWCLKRFYEGLKGLHETASKGFMKALKAFMKPSEAPQRSAKIKS